METAGADPDELFRVELGPEPGDVRFIGELDVAGADRAAEALATSGAAADLISVDLSALTFLDSSGIRVLLQQLAAQRAKGGDLVLRTPSAEVRRIIEILDLEANGVRIEGSSA